MIPSGRSGGKVSNKTFMEYTTFGGGDPSTAGKSGGPYRNNAIFNQWEDTVLDIQREKKYQPIFNIGTKLKVGDDLIEKAGANLRKFMTDMLDGDELVVEHWYLEGCWIVNSEFGSLDYDVLSKENGKPFLQKY